MSTTQATELDATKQRILEAAGPIFAERGFQAATVREICNRAGVNLAAINYHFGDKERLFRETVRLVHQQRSAAFPMPQWPEGTPAEKRLEEVIRTLLTRMLGGDSEQDWHCQLMLRVLSQPSEASVEVVEEYIRPHFQLLMRVLDDLLPADVPLERKRLIAFSIAGQCVYYRVAAPVIDMLAPAKETARFDPEYLGRHITAFTLAAIGRRPPLVDGETSR